ncbi:hypothetical protein BDZ97DRAFT_1903269 [Flammula alnicola]|nr:hypothetical protein BDZ97DRAFT_1903269 [Flammula alnicola]
MGTSTADVNISLEPHLLDTLKPVCPLLPHEIAHQLEQYLAHPPPPLIPYKALFAVSQWARSDQGQKSLKSRGLDFQSYSMIALLAGTTTSPERKFGDYVPPKEAEEIEADRIRERKAITVLLNALLSIGGVAFAAWWAAERTGWKNEWRVLFALFAAILVAGSEAGLYMIWLSRRSTSKTIRTKMRSARHKKVDPVPETNSDSDDTPKVIAGSTDDETAMATLRHRR